MTDNQHPERMLQWFEYKHLLYDLREVSGSICKLAHDMEACLQPGPERTAGLRKLLEAKDCFVRQKVLDLKSPRIPDDEDGS